MTEFLAGSFASPLQWALAFLAAFCVGLSKGGLPVVGMLSVPILALVMPPLQAAALILPVYVVSDFVGLYIYRREYSRRNLAILVPAGFLGVTLGWATVSVLPDRAITLAVGLLGVLFCVDAFLKRRRVLEARPADVPRGLFWGILSGLSSFVAHAGGPPFQMYVLPQRLPKMIFAGTGTILFAIVNWMKLGYYWQLGEITVAATLRPTLVLLPVAVGAAFLGVLATRRIDEKLFFRLVEIVLLGSSLMLIYKALSA